MSRCERCGNEYDKTFQVTVGSESHTFDCFECAAATLAPQCESCGVTILGHGLEADGKFFCCEHCAENVGVDGLKDRL